LGLGQRERNSAREKERERLSLTVSGGSPESSNVRFSTVWSSLIHSAFAKIFNSNNYKKNTIIKKLTPQPGNKNLSPSFLNQC
jgi:hypothetical protein